MLVYLAVKLTFELLKENLKEIRRNHKSSMNSYITKNNHNFSRYKHSKSRKSITQN